MNTLVLLMALLVLSYVGSVILDRGRNRGLARPSGIEYVLLGVLAGPQTLGLIEPDMVTAVSPLAHVALGWLAFGLGLETFHVGPKVVRGSSFVLGTLVALLTAGTVGAAVFALGRAPLGEHGALAWAAAFAAVSAQCARYTIPTDAGMNGGGGFLHRLLEVAHTGAIVPLLVIGVVFARTTTATATTAVSLPWPAWLGVTVGLGLLLGIVAAVLLAREPRLGESWAVLLGTALFVIGIAVRLQLSALCAGFCLGLTLSALSRHREEMVTMVAPTQRAFMIPALILAGAHIQLRPRHDLPWLAVVLGARIVAHFAGALVLRAGGRELRPAGATLGLALLPGGLLAMALGLSLALRFPEGVGPTALFVTAVLTLLGELLGPGGLRVSMARANAADGVPADVATEAPAP